MKDCAKQDKYKLAALLTSIVLFTVFGISVADVHPTKVNQDSPPAPLTAARSVCKIGLRTVLAWPGTNSVDPQKLGIYTPEDEVFESGIETEMTDRPDTQTSVADFLISGDRLFFLDAASPSIKCFSTEGKLIWTIETRTHGMYILGAYGDDLYVLMSEVPQKIRAFNKLGEVRNYNEKLMKQLQDSLGNTIHLKDVSWIGVDHLGRLHCAVDHSDRVDWVRLEAQRGHFLEKTTIPQSLTHQRFMLNRHDGSLFIFDKIENGVAIGTQYLDVNGDVIFANRERTIGRLQVGKLSQNGTYSHLTALPNSDLTEFESGLVDSGNIDLDSNGKFYKLAKSSIQYPQLLGDVIVSSYEVVLQFSSSGRFEGVRAVIKRGPDKSKSFGVDADGNVYYLQFHKTHLAVMKAPRP